MKKLLLFHHYNKYNNISEYVLYCLHEVHKYFDFIVFTSNSYLSKEEKDFLKKEYCDIVLERKNKGFDFGAWKHAINYLGFKEISNYDCLVLMNDTCFGPLYDIGEVFKIMAAKNVDFWGITNHRKTPYGMPGTNEPIPEHIQSYFLCFNKKVITSKIFKRFWVNVDDNLIDVNKVIQKYETQLTTILKDEGFSYDVYIDTSKNNFIHPNALNCHTDILLLKYKIPFVKIKTFLWVGDSETPKNVLDIIKKEYKYPISLIENHVYKLLNPNDSVYFKNFNIDKVKKKHELKEFSYKDKIAIHIHVTSVKNFKNYIKLLKNSKYQFYLLISTDNESNAKKIKNILIYNDIYKKIKMQDIVIYPKIKGDIYPLISSFEFLKDEYTIIGYIHINKVYSFFKRVWLQRMLKRILNIDNILQVFSQNKNIGIIITDISNIIKNNRKLSWGRSKDVYKKIWDLMKCKKEFSINKYEIPIMSTDVMFWYKREALQPLYELNSYTVKDFVEQNILDEKIFYEAIEKLLVYIAWDKNYDYRIIVDKDNNISQIEKIINYKKLMMIKKYTRRIKYKIFRTFN